MNTILVSKFYAKKSVVTIKGDQMVTKFGELKN